MAHYLYLLINLGAISVPFLFSFHPKLRFDKQWKFFFPALLIPAVVFIVWDIYFTDLGVWGFNPNYLSGFYIGSLPIEEILFFICIPYCCVFTYHCLTLFFKFEWPKKTFVLFNLSLLTILLFLGGMHIDKLYTSFTFIGLGTSLFLITFFDLTHHLPKIYSVYFFLLIPFLIVNGLLTGTGLDEPIVWYNNSENLGLRILTIPVEDIFYGFLLISSTLFIYNYLIQKQSKTISN